MELAIPYYPVNEFGPAMKGMVIGGLGIVHVFLAQFAIGGGALLCYMQWLAQSGRDPNARTFIDGYFQTLVLVSFVAGAVTGVAMWLVSIQTSPRTIGLMVDEFHWVWAIEWVFFSVEVVAGYTFYRAGARLSDRLRLRLLIVYSVAAWGSLFWINGILSWQLTPGGWSAEGSVWAGFFNPSFWPSLLFRTVVALTIAALVACVVVNAMASRGLDRPARAGLIQRISRLLAPMLAMPVLAVWFVLVIPEDSRGWILGGSAAMSLFVAIAAGASLLIGSYALLGLWRKRLYINGATATLLVALAFGATAGGEFVREGARKPYTVREILYSNSITPDELAVLRDRGSVAADPYPLRYPEQYPNDQLRVGAKVYRFQCSVCHTIDGANGIVHLAGGWSARQLRMNLAALQHTKPFMPPFAGTASELEALVQLVRWSSEGAPAQWPTSEAPQLMARLAQWLAEAGTEPGSKNRSHQ